MPTKCSASGCENFYSKDVPFFDLPTPSKYKFCSEKAELSKKRRQLWLDAMGISDDSSAILRICSKHFLTGKPAALEDPSVVDWVPTLHVKLRLSRRHRRLADDNERGRRKDSHRRSHSSEEKVTSRPSKSYEKQSKSHKPGGVKKMENKRNSRNMDLKKFQNCKILLNGNIQCPTFKGTNGSGLTISQKHGYFTSDKVTVKETALNNTVLRIHLTRENLHALKRKYRSLHSPPRNIWDEKVSSFGRQIKRKKYSPEDVGDITPYFKRNIDIRPVDSIRNSVSVKTERSMRNNQNDKEDKTTSIHNKIQGKHEFMSISEPPKTLNKPIKRNYRDKIKIKLFPKTRTPIRRVVKNGSIDLTSDKPLQLQRKVLFVKHFKNESERYKSDKTYFLKFSSYPFPDDGILNYSFQKLITDVKHMKLPAPNWKIKVIIKQGKISAITFTNKLTPERCVGFSANNNNYKIIIDDKPALLLGSPNCVHTSTDLEILLDVIQNIDSKNPMIFYK